MEAGERAAHCHTVHIITVSIQNRKSNLPPALFYGEKIKNYDAKMMRHISLRISSIYKGSKTGGLGVTAGAEKGDLRKRGGDTHTKLWDKDELLRFDEI